MRQHLTQQFCERVTPPSGKPQETYQDDFKASRDAVSGLALRVNPRGKSWVFLRAFNGQRYRTLGYFPVMGLDEARRTAREWHATMDKGIDPQGGTTSPAATAGAATGTVDGGGEFNATTFTVAQAFDFYAGWLTDNHKSPRTIKLVKGEKSEAQRRWKAFLKRPLLTIRKADAKTLHKAVKRELGGNPDDPDCTKGSGSANRAIRLFQAAFSKVASEYENFPADARNPIRKGFGFFAEESRNSKVLWAELPAWWDETAKLSPIRRDAWRLILFTGLRNTDATSIKWEHIDFENGTLFRPSPKGGRSKAFTTPLSTAALAILRARKRDNTLDLGRADEGWVFPTTSRKTGKTVCIGKLKEYLMVDGHKVTNPTLKMPHDIRRTFQNAARKAGVAERDYKILMNHGGSRKAGKQSEQYNVSELEELRGDTQRATIFLLGHIGVAVDNGSFVASEQPAPVAQQSTPDDPQALLKQMAELQAKLTAMMQKQKGAA